MKQIKTPAPTPSPRVLTMCPDGDDGWWRPRTAEDRRLLRLIQRPRDGDAIGQDYGVAGLVALCQSRGVTLTFEPDSPPLPAGKPRSRR